MKVRSSAFKKANERSVFKTVTHCKEKKTLNNKKSENVLEAELHNFCFYTQRFYFDILTFSKQKISAIQDESFCFVKLI